MTRGILMLSILLTISVATLAVAAEGSAAGEPVAAAAAAGDARVERGRFMVTLGGCHDCHTPVKVGADGPEPDLGRMLSGHPQEIVLPPAPELPPGPWVATVAGTMTAWSGPWGTSFTANLTPDDETGLGRWTEQEFVAALKTGRHQGRGREILPPMPWQNLAQLPEEELGAIYAYLRTIPPVTNRVPAPIPPAAAH
jgi:mono/diheme cytochrome c family protein